MKFDFKKNIKIVKVQIRYLIRSSRILKNIKRMQKFESGTVERFHALFDSVRFGSGREKSSKVSLYLFLLCLKIIRFF